MAVGVQIQHLLASSRSHRKCHLAQDYPYLIDLNILNIMGIKYINEVGGEEITGKKAGQVHVKKNFRKKNRDRIFVWNVLVLTALEISPNIPKDPEKSLNVEIFSLPLGEFGI